MNEVRMIAGLIGLCSALLLAACTDGSGDAARESTTAASPKADAAMVAEAADQAAAPVAATHPLCSKTNFAELSAAVGGNFDTIDIIDEPDLHYIECVFLDSSDLYAGMTIRFIPTVKLVATASKWQTASAYFDEWARTGTPIADVGERAAWIELPAGLLVLAGNQALQFSASKADLSDPAVRARFETLARAVIERLP